MPEYMDAVTYVEITISRLNQAYKRVTEEEYMVFKFLAGEIMWVGGRTSP